MKSEAIAGFRVTGGWEWLLSGILPLVAQNFIPNNWLLFLI
jgi:nitric oxide synthase oxygenase domain/subunit